jgi:hypothetical protein
VLLSGIKSIPEQIHFSHAVLVSWEDSSVMESISSGTAALA